MLGFSIGKLLVLAAIVAALWYGFKWIGRYQQVQKTKAREGQGGGQGEGERDREIGAENMVACAVCGDYVVARGTTSCGRDDCPYPR